MYDQLGTAGMSDKMLMAHLMGQGKPTESSIKAAEIIAQAMSVCQVLRSSDDLLAKMVRGTGVGPGKIRALKCGLELGVRTTAPTAVGAAVGDPEAAAALMYDKTLRLPHEAFFVLCMNSRNMITHDPVCISNGILNATLVHAREVFCVAVERRASCIIMVHNHPSGDPTPSREDIKITGDMIQAGRVLGIKLMDHLVMGLKRAGESRYFCSIRESGLVMFED